MQVVLKVPEILREYFALDMVTDHSWGLYVQPRPSQPKPTTSRVVLKPPKCGSARRTQPDSMENTQEPTQEPFPPTGKHGRRGAQTTGAARRKHTSARARKHARALGVVSVPEAIPAPLV